MMVPGVGIYFQREPQPLAPIRLRVADYPDLLEAVNDAIDMADRTGRQIILAGVPMRESRVTYGRILPLDVP